MDYSKYFDYAPTGGAPVNKFQYDGKYHILKWVDMILFMDYIIDDEGNWIPTGDNKFQFNNDFLDYHFSKYNGAPEEFFFFLRSLIVHARSWGGRDLEIDNLYSPIIEKWIKKTEKMPHQTDFKISKKKYDSLTRSRAFCIKLMQDEGKINYYDLDKKNWKKTELQNYIEILWENQSGQTVYEDFLKIDARYDSFKKEYKRDFDYGQKIFEDLKH
jgi:hypothetical protein